MTDDRPPDLDASGKPIVRPPDLDAHGKPIAAAAPAASPWEHPIANAWEGVKTSLGKLNPLAKPPTREQQNATFDAQMQQPRQPFGGPADIGRSIYKGVTSITPQQIGEGAADLGAMYAGGKVAGAVHPDTISAGVNAAGKGVDLIGRGAEAVGDATIKGSPLAAAAGIYGTHSPWGAAAGVVPVIAKFGGQGLRAIGRGMQSEPPAAPYIDPLSTRTGSTVPPPQPGPVSPATGAQPWAMPMPPKSPAPPVTGTGTAVPPPVAPSRQWSMSMPGRPPVAAPGAPATGTGQTPASAAGSVTWGNFGAKPPAAEPPPPATAPPPPEPEPFEGNFQERSKYPAAAPPPKPPPPKPPPVKPQPDDAGPASMLAKQNELGARDAAAKAGVSPDDLRNATGQRGKVPDAAQRRIDAYASTLTAKQIKEQALTTTNTSLRKTLLAMLEAVGQKPE